MIQATKTNKTVLWGDNSQGMVVVVIWEKIDGSLVSDELDQNECRSLVGSTQLETFTFHFSSVIDQLEQR